ncbi:hypothetical protein GEMRC1_005040 [Eukaryota sp. GEM-RC1]
MSVQIPQNQSQRFEIAIHNHLVTGSLSYPLTEMVNRRLWDDIVSEINQRLPMKNYYHWLIFIGYILWMFIAWNFIPMSGGLILLDSVLFIGAIVGFIITFRSRRDLGYAAVRLYIRSQANAALEQNKLFLRLERQPKRDFLIMEYVPNATPALIQQQNVNVQYVEAQIPGQTAYPVLNSAPVQEV